MVRDIDITAAIESRVKVLRQLSGTEAYRHFVLLLDEMKDAHLLGLVDAAGDAIQQKQGATKQVIALRAALMADGLSPLV